MQKLEVKKGDTFVAACTYLDEAGLPKDYVAASITIKSQVRTTRGKLLSELSVTAGSGTGEFVLRGATADWPAGDVLWDIQFSQGAEIFSTKTATLVVSNDVTQ